MWNILVLLVLEMTVKSSSAWKAYSGEKDKMKLANVYWEI